MKKKNHKTALMQPKQLRKLKKTTRVRWQLRFLSRRAVRLKAMKNRRQLLRLNRRRRLVKHRNEHSIKRISSQRKYRYFVAPLRVQMPATTLSVLICPRPARSDLAFYRRARAPLRFHIRKLQHANRGGSRILIKNRRRFLQRCKQQLQVRAYLHLAPPLHRPARKLRTHYYLATAKYRLRRSSLISTVTRKLAQIRRLRARFRNPKGVFVWRKKRPRRPLPVSKAAVPTTGKSGEKKKPTRRAKAHRAIAQRKRRRQRLQAWRSRKARKRIRRRRIRILRRFPLTARNPRRRVLKELQKKKIQPQRRGARKQGLLRFSKLLKLRRARRLRLYRRNSFTQPSRLYRPRTRQYLSIRRLVSKRHKSRRQRRTIFMNTRRSRAKLRKYGRLHYGTLSANAVLHKLARALKKQTILRKRKKQLPGSLRIKYYLRARRRNTRRRARKSLSRRKLRRNAPWKKLMFALKARRKHKARILRKPKVTVLRRPNKKWKRRWLRRKRRALRRSLRRRRTRRHRFGLRRSGVAKYRFQLFRRTVFRFSKRVKPLSRIFKKLRTKGVAQRVQWLNSVTKTTRRLNALPLVQQYTSTSPIAVKNSTLPISGTHSALPYFRASMRSRARIFRRCRRRQLRLLRLRGALVTRRRRRLKRKLKRRRRLPTLIFRRRRFQRWLRRKKYWNVKNFTKWGNFRIWWIRRYREQYGPLALRKKANPLLRAVIKRHIRKLAKRHKSFKKILRRRRLTCSQFFVGSAYFYKQNNRRKTVRRAVALKPRKVIHMYSVRKNRLLRPLSGRLPRVAALHSPRPRRISAVYSLLRTHSRALFANSVTRQFLAQNEHALRIAPYRGELRENLQAARMRHSLRARKVTLCRKVRTVSGRFKRVRRFRIRLRRYSSQRWLIRRMRRRRQVVARLAGQATQFRSLKKFSTRGWRRKPISVDDYYKWKRDCRDHNFDMKLLSVYVIDELYDL